VLFQVWFTYHNRAEELMKVQSVRYVYLSHLILYSGVVKVDFKSAAVDEVTAVASEPVLARISGGDVQDIVMA